MELLTLNKITRLFLTIILTSFIGLAVNAQMEFVENKGQWNSKVNFKGDFSSGSFYLESRGFTVDMHNTADLLKISGLFHGHGNTSVTAAKAPADTIGISQTPQNNTPLILRSHAYKVNFLGSNTSVTAVPDKIQPGYNNYLLGNDETKWASNCKIYEAVTYKNIYPNIDIRYYTAEGQLKYDFIVRPGGNPDAIAMRYDGTTKLEIKNKELIIGTSVGDVKELYPYSYQSITGKRQVVDCKYVLTDNVIRFKVQRYSPTETLIIDPTLIFSSFTGSRQDNWGYTATPGPGGTLFAGGIALGGTGGYPVSPGAYQTVFAGGVSDDINAPYDMAIFKFSSNGSQRLYATYIGGDRNEQPHSMICDPQGNLVIAGRSASHNFPGTPARPASTSDYDIVLIKLNATGTGILGAQRIGGTANDGMNIRGKYNLPEGADATRRNYGDDARSEVILDAAGNIFLASCTQSNNFPVTPGTPIQPAFGGGRQDGVIMKFTPNLSAVLFSSYFGGSGDDACFVMSINPTTGNLYVAGGTTSNNLPGNKTGVITATYQGGETDGFITEITPNGAALLRTTYQGTTGNDLVYGIQFDKFGFPYIMGTTTGAWTVFNAPYSNAGGKQFISKLRPDLSAYVYSTVFGTNSSAPNLSPIAFLVDRCQNVYVSGWGGGLNISKQYPSAGTAGLPLKNQLVDPSTGQPLTQPDGADFYFFVLERNAQSQLFGSYFGRFGGLGDHVVGGTSRFDANGVIYQAICSCEGTNGGPFPTTIGVWGSVNGSPNCNEAVAKIEMNFAGVGASVKASIDGVIDTVGCVPLTVNFVDTLAKGKMYIWHYRDPSNTKIDTTYAPNNTTSHTYNDVGTYELMLVSIDSSTCNIADTAYITVRVGNNEVIPDFNFTKLDSCASLRFRFDNLSTAPNPAFTNTSFIWDFGDGSPRIRTGLGAQFHTFPSIGQYNVRLIVDDTTFCNAPDSIAKMVRINPNVKAIFSTSSRGCVSYTPVFQNNSLGGISWLWDFGDNTFSTDFEPTHTYTLVGSYNVRLIAIDPSTCNGADTSDYFTITVYPIPTANFTWSPNPPLENTRTNFTNLSVGATRYLWDFGDGETSTEVNPVHQFNRTDTFHVILSAYNDADCVDTFDAFVPIIIRPLLDVPNAFTPGRFASGSYNNGIVKVEGFGVGKMMWKIYNRWGQVVFSTTNIRQGWDGTFKGALQPMDVYAYTLDVEFTDGVKLRKTGDITLLR